MEFLAPAIDDLDQRVDALADETKDAPSIPSLANAMEKLLDLLEADIELVSNSALPASVNPGKSSRHLPFDHPINSHLLMNN